jgi:anti-sigma B factor antagonist/stage II sporulation protein AA (anti-sigma F factor antagonist)
MKLNTISGAGYLVVAPVGRIDQLTAVVFQESVQPFVAQCSAAGKALILDFGAVEYLSSVGLRALMVTSRQCKSAGVSLAIAGLQPLVQEVFDIARFQLVVRCFASTEAAIQALPA